jgi:hypothetical protein
MNYFLLSEMDYFVLHHFEQCAYHSTGVEANRQVTVGFTNTGFLISLLLLIILKAILHSNGKAR